MWLYALIIITPTFWGDKITYIPFNDLELCQKNLTRIAETAKGRGWCTQTSYDMTQIIKELNKE